MERYIAASANWKLSLAASSRVEIDVKQIELEAPWEGHERVATAAVRWHRIDFWAVAPANVDDKGPRLEFIFAKRCTLNER